MSRWLNTALGFIIGVIAVPVLGSLLTRAVGAYYGDPERDVQQVTALAMARQIADALDRFRQERQRMPTATEGLAVLAPQYLERMPTDPWGNPFLYAPSSDGLWADVMSYGSDGESAGAGTAADVSARFGMLGPRPPQYLSWFGELLALIIPLIGLLGGGRPGWAAGLLAGNGSLCAVLLLALVDGPLDISLLLSFVVGLTCLVGSVALLRHVRGAPILTFIAIVAAHTILSELISI